MAKSAKQITQFVKSAFSMYGLDYSQFFYDFDDDDMPIPAPIFKDNSVDKKTIDDLSKILGISPESVLNADLSESKKWYNKYSFFSHLPKIQKAMQGACYSDNGYAETILKKAIYSDKCGANIPLRYDVDNIKSRLIAELKRIDAVIPNTFHNGAEIQNLKIATQHFYSYPQINSMVLSFLEMFERLKYLFFKAKDSLFELEQDEIDEYNFLVTVFNAEDIAGSQKLYYDSVVKLRKVYEAEQFKDFFSYVKISNVSEYFTPWLCKEFSNDKELFQLYINIYPKQLSHIRETAMLISKFECTFNWSDATPLNIDGEEDIDLLDDNWLEKELEDFSKITDYYKTVYIDKTPEELGNDEQYTKQLSYLIGTPSMGGVTLPKRELAYNGFTMELMERTIIHSKALRGENDD